MPPGATPARPARRRHPAAPRVGNDARHREATPRGCVSRDPSTMMPRPRQSFVPERQIVKRDPAVPGGDKGGEIEQRVSVRRAQSAVTRMRAAWLLATVAGCMWLV
jgi:hypothetical protein